jgi:hypothetical protein
MMLTWSSLVLGISGQSIFLLSYALFILLGYGVIRGMLSLIITDISSVLYRIPDFTNDASDIANLSSSILGIPMGIIQNVDFKNSMLYRYLFAGFPDAIIAPAFFFIGYGLMGTSIDDSRNFLAIFVGVIGIVLQITLFKVHPALVILNILFGFIFGMVMGSYVSGDTNNSPYSTIPAQKVSVSLSVPSAE